MEENKKHKEDSNPYKLLELIPREKKWIAKIEDGGGGGPTTHHGFSEEKKLELRLGLPCGDDDHEQERKPKKREGYNGNYHNPNYQPLSVGYFSPFTNSYSSSRTNIASCSQDQKLGLWPPWGDAKDSSQPCNSRMVGLLSDKRNNKDVLTSCADPAVPNISHKRAAPSPIVGWPPVRSLRKKLASSSSVKAVPDPPRAPPVKAKENSTENGSHKGLFVKINMEGVVIGRKVDLRAHDNYDKLCSAVDTLFRGLLAAQMDSSSCGVQSKQEGEKPITGLLDGSGEYTLVYEDNEGDKMLVGDVPWQMFVSSVKRLRVLKTSELPSLSKVAGGKEGKLLKR